jgi:hypothetical protein
MYVPRHPFKQKVSRKKRPVFACGDGTRYAILFSKNKPAFTLHPEYGYSNRNTGMTGNAEALQHRNSQAGFNAGLPC